MFMGNWCVLHYQFYWNYFNTILFKKNQILCSVSFLLSLYSKDVKMNIFLKIQYVKKETIKLFTKAGHSYSSLCLERL